MNTQQATEPFVLPPWMAMVQCAADQAEARTRALTETTTSLARDITNSAVEDIVGPRPARHRKDT